MRDELDTLEKQLASYVAFCRRHIDPHYSLRDALIRHRRRCLENLLDEGKDYWAERVRLLDRLADRKGVPLVDEPSLRSVLDELSARERAWHEERRNLVRARDAAERRRMGRSDVGAGWQDGWAPGAAGDGPEGTGTPPAAPTTGGDQ